MYCLIIHKVGYWEKGACLIMNLLYVNMLIQALNDINLSSAHSCSGNCYLVKVAVKVLVFLVSSCTLDCYGSIIFFL